MHTAVTNNRDELLSGIGRRVRSLRERHGMTRKSMAAAAGVSERHLANLEYGEGNPTIIVLSQIACALECSMAELLGDATTASPERLLIRSLLQHEDEASLRRIRLALSGLLGGADPSSALNPRIALIGMRGAGKSTLGKRLAARMNLHFVELSAEIEELAGCTVAEIQNLYGEKGYRRFERQALQATINNHERAVIAIPGGIVSDPATFNLLLANSTSIWLQASPEDHMQRVIDQGDLRPIAASKEAASDLLAILTSRSPFYAKADFTLDTSERDLDSTLTHLISLVSAPRATLETEQ